MFSAISVARVKKKNNFSCVSFRRSKVPRGVVTSILFCCFFCLTRAKELAEKEGLLVVWISYILVETGLLLISYCDIAHASPKPSYVDVPLPSSSIMMREFSVAD